MLIFRGDMPRAGHPLKEGLRRPAFPLFNTVATTPRAGHPLKEGLRHNADNFFVSFHNYPERVIH